MATHDMSEILGPAVKVPLKASWLVERLGPQVLAELLMGQWQQAGASVRAILEIETRFEQKRESGPIHVEVDIAKITSYKARFAGKKRASKYSNLARFLGRIWNVDRCIYHSDMAWAESAMSRPDVQAEMRTSGVSIKVETLVKWPRAYDWRRDARKASAS